MTANAVLVPDGPDAGLVWHCGAPLREQQRMSGGAGILWLANREGLAFDAPRWELEGTPGLRLSHDGLWAHADPGWGQALVPRLRSSLGLGVWLRPDLTVVWRGARLPDPVDAVAANASPVPDGVEWIVSAPDPASEEAESAPEVGQTRSQLTPGADIADSDAPGFDFVPHFPDTPAPGTVPGTAPGELLLPDVAAPVGIWAYEALRIAAGVPRIGLDLPLTPGEGPSAADIALTRLLLDTDELPAVGEPIIDGGRIVGRCGSSAQHYTWGPIALALLTPGLPDTAQLRIGAETTATIWA